MMMKKNIYDDASLIRKSLLEDLEEGEQKELGQLLDNPEIQEVYGQLSDPVYLKKQFIEYENYSGKKGYTVFKEKINRARRVRMIRWGAAVAAVWVIALGIMLWMTSGEKNGDEKGLPVASNIIPAGEKRARLTLADGSTVMIAETSTRVLKEKGARIEYKNGEIFYNTEIKTTEIVYNELEVPRGGECIITLDDGTKVWVNAETKLKYPVSFAGEQREVILEGEAFFEVVKDKKPFIVKTSFGDVRVLGTAFGINAYVDQPEGYTTLVRGKVSVTAGAGEPLVIQPGEQVVSSKDGKTRKQEVNVDEFVGWKDGIYVFRDKKLVDIMNTLERWYNISVLFEDESLKSLLFTGNLKRYDDINVFFDALSRTGDLKYRVERNHVILYK
ncbi:FecR domain-containing protein [Butyricimonas sp. NSJ-56]|uniref:FecR domain-containing protein n=2 Tax=Butyricimonas hominis TaxID=2763032 RepID=A0ABR7CXZ9_9BACT|nr:FecR domain-containing protein [Butyricimonas hominis]